MADTRVVMEVVIADDFDTDNLPQLIRAAASSDIGESWKFDADTFAVVGNEPVPAAEGAFVNGEWMVFPQFTELSDIHKSYLRLLLAEDQTSSE